MCGDKKYKVQKLKKWGLRFLLFIAVILIAFIIYIEVQKEELVAVAIEEANQTINGTITYDDADISFLKSFPDLGLSLHNVHISSLKDTVSLPLLKTDKFTVHIDIISLFRKSEPIQITSLTLDKALLYLTLDKEGNPNYKIFKESSAETSSAIDLNIEDFKLSNATIFYSDATNRLKAEIKELDMRGQIKYINEYATIKSTTTSNILVDYNTILPAYSFMLKTNSQIVLNPTFDNIEIQNFDAYLNDLPVSVVGLLTIGNDYSVYNFSFSSPETEIKKLLSVIPVYYKTNYSNMVGSGTYLLKGIINGTTEYDYPLYDIQLTTRDGAFTYPNINRSVDKISFKLEVINTTASQAFSKINVKDLDIRSTTDHLKGNIEISDIKNRREANFNLTTDLNLSHLSELMLLEKGTNLQGQLRGKIQGEAVINNDQKESIVTAKDFMADILMTDLIYNDRENKIRIDKVVVDGNKTKINYDIESLVYNDAMDGFIKGHFENPLNLMLADNPVLKGYASLQAGTININKFATTDTVQFNYISIPETDISFDAQVEKIVQSTYELNNVTGTGTLLPKNAPINFAIGNINDSKIEGAAKLNNILAYGINNDTLSGSITIKSDNLVLDKWMNVENTASADEPYTDLIPKNMDLDINYSSDQITFKNLDISKSLGQVSLKEKKLAFKNEGDIFGGKILLVGGLEVISSDKLHLNLSLEMNELRFQETAKKTRIFSDILPIAKLIEGNYTARLNWNSDLNSSYLPDLSTLSAYGEIETKNGSINGILPIDTFIRKFVNIGSDQSIEISDTKKYFIIENGRVLVKKIDIKIKDVVISLSGSHGFNQDLDYQVLIDIPKSKINSNNIFNFIQDKIAFSDRLKSYSDNVSIQVVGYMGGSIKKPQLSVKKINLKSGSVVENVEDRLNETLTDLKDKISNTVKDTLTGISTTLKSKVQATTGIVESKKDSVLTVINSGIDSSKTLISKTVANKKEALKNEEGILLDDLKSGNVDSLKKSIEGIFGNRQGQLDSLKHKFPTIPFKKKKNN